MKKLISVILSFVILYGISSVFLIETKAKDSQTEVVGKQNSSIILETRKKEIDNFRDGFEDSYKSLRDFKLDYTDLTVDDKNSLLEYKNKVLSEIKKKDKKENNRYIIITVVLVLIMILYYVTTTRD